MKIMAIVDRRLQSAKECRTHILSSGGEQKGVPNQVSTAAARRSASV